MPPVPGRLLTLRLYYFASFAALGACVPFFPRWLEARGVEGLSMGVIAGLLPAMGVLGPPAVGLLADAFGLRGSLLRFACFGACLALVALERARAARTTYGKLRLWGSVGFLVATLAIGRLLDPGASAPLPATIAALLFVALLAAWTLPAKPDTLRLPVTREARVLVAAPDFALFLVTSVLARIAHASYDLCYSLHRRDFGVSDRDTDLAWAAGVSFEVALMAVAEPLMTRFSAPSLVIFALLQAKMLRDVLITADKTSIPAVVFKHQKGKEAWCIATNRVDLGAADVIKLYARRFTIEETFRDIKDNHFGMGLSATHIGSPQRRDRLLLMAAMAQALLTLLGAAGEACGLDRMLKANTVKTRTMSLYRQGCCWYRATPMMQQERLIQLMNTFGELVSSHAAFRDIFGLI